MTLPQPEGLEELASEFYAGVLGLAPVAKPEAMGRQGCWFQLPDGRQIHLQVRQPFQPLQDPHPALVVEDWQAAMDALAAGGCRWEPDDRWPGIDRGFTFDPFGNRIELMSAAGLRAQGLLA